MCRHLPPIDLDAGAHRQVSDAQLAAALLGQRVTPHKRALHKRMIVERRQQEKDREKVQNRVPRVRESMAAQHPSERAAPTWVMPLFGSVGSVSCMVPSSK